MTPSLSLLKDHWTAKLRELWSRPVNPEPIYRAGARLIARLIYHPHYSGFEKLPKTGPAIIICNHVSYVDGLIIAAGSDRPIRFIIDDYIYRLPPIHYFMKYNRAIPIAPTREKVAKALQEVSDGLKAGDIICIFPEGQLTYTGSLGRFRPGIEWIIKQNPVPVYPMALTGLWGSVFSRKYRKAPFRFIPRKWNREVKAIIGDPLPPDKISVNILQEVVLRLKYLL